MSERPGRRPDGKVRFEQRLTVPLTWYPLPLLGAAIMAATVHRGYPGVRSWLPYVVTIGLVLAWLWWMGRVRVRVVDDELWVGEAHLPLRFVGDVEIVPADQKRRALGPELDPAAFLTHRGWVGPLLRVHLTDPDDPTPYWIFSVRDPERLAAILREERPA
ncbi:Protein of unknown function (DUF3093) [Streptoalloteichus tenebrarius]|uniref:DUF3093 domain-containing protein n=1 Tax=Streptoalloteichus tenebrarius (strain ATCC 17920 / DSM 40477 / JCM 4838 / CBS 697.72 / NBRC 16177 / NCIMB 11028 / NRRL B-12390 / A12253. 1 / ISP 5477) TaxID=1933 RepID=A0ABT1HMX2_STRSD|nr:DUF3093 domain-containing protein [Streptoalloteichus tenebrarius]MCP2256853.1 Protein of unknown function (DUF3093) [Streptoalloteichus tenebrarius]BFF00240.1 DUF3093 domain-containing protein [Streptoalloteichus tenebrarius]